MNATAATAFIRAHTRLLAPPHVPELRLHLADEVYDLWDRTGQFSGTRPPLPFWAFAWPGGQALARYVLDHPDVAQGRTVLDLAAGSGIVAIAAALSGAASVTACDIDSLAIEAIALNAQANGVRLTTRCDDILDGHGADADLVLAGDVFYERPMAARVLPFLLRAHARGARVLVGDPGRTYLPHLRFRALATYEIPVHSALEDTPVKRTTIWHPDWD